MVSAMIVDAFTSTPFKGNPAAVVFLNLDLHKKLPDSWFQNLAKEINLSETAFIAKRGNNCFALRWFTPHGEVALCGHATLASAHALWTYEVAKSAPIHFYTKSGILTATELLSSYKGFIQLDFPITTVSEAVGFSSDLHVALGIVEENIFFHGESKFDRIIELKGGRSALRSLRPSFQLLKRVQTKRGFVVTTEGDMENDFYSRCFFPGNNVNEDPVCGSAHCALVPYWESKGLKPISGQWFRSFQLSSRTGVVLCRRGGDRVFLAGQAVTMGELNFSPAAVKL